MRKSIGFLHRPSGLWVLAVGLGLAGAAVAPAAAGPPGGQTAAGATIPQAPAELSARCGAVSGTMVVEGGGSSALFLSGSETRLVGEGEEIVPGVRLMEVRADAIVVQDNGRAFAIPLSGRASSGAGEATAAAPQAPGQNATGTVQAPVPGGSVVEVAREAGWLQSRNADAVKARMEWRQQRAKELRAGRRSVVPGSQGGEQ